jgi:DNA polymerase
MKEEELKKIANIIEHCIICKSDKSGKAVSGEGNADAEIVFIGEAPGRNEALTGRPFIGRSGKFLREQIELAGISAKDVFITSVVKYLPDYITPKPQDIEHGRTHLFKQLDVIDPKIIVLLGNVACIGVLGEKIPIAKDHGTILEKNGKKYFFSYHPSAAIRFQKIRELFKKDFTILANLIKS